MMPIEILRMGGATGLDQQTVTTGGPAAAPPNAARGYNSVSPYGSISDGTSNIYGTAVRSLNWVENGGSPNCIIRFEVTGLQANSGWTNMSISGPNGTFNYTRASASYYQAGGQTFWDWTGQSFTTTTNPYNGSSSTVIVTFT